MLFKKWQSVQVDLSEEMALEWKAEGQNVEYPRGEYFRQREAPMQRP